MVADAHPWMSIPFSPHPPHSHPLSICVNSISLSSVHVCLSVCTHMHGCADACMWHVCVQGFGWVGGGRCVCVCMRVCLCEPASQGQANAEAVGRAPKDNRRPAHNPHNKPK